MIVWCHSSSHLGIRKAWRWSVHTPRQWPTQRTSSISSMRNLTLSLQQSCSLTSFSSSGTSMLELGQTTKPGKKSLEGMALVNATATASYFSICVPPTTLSSPTHWSIFPHATRLLGCIHNPGIGIPDRLCHHQDRRETTRCESDKGHVWCQLLDWPSTDSVQVQTPHPALEKTPGPENCKAAKHSQAE